MALRSVARKVSTHRGQGTLCPVCRRFPARLRAIICQSCAQYFSYWDGRTVFQHNNYKEATALKNVRQAYLEGEKPTRKIYRAAKLDYQTMKGAGTVKETGKPKKD